jgi:hypothetical protein
LWRLQVEDAFHAVTQLAQTTMRSELGKLTLDKTFEERESLNMNIVEAINQAAKAWGISCLRYEIRACCERVPWVARRVAPSLASSFSLVAVRPSRPDRAWYF